MVVDDDTDSREMIITVLEMEGYTVTGLDNGRQVMENIRKDPPDIILLDVMLGDTNGFEICSSIKEDLQSRLIPVMMVSAIQGYETSCDQASLANDFLCKPFDISELLGKVTSLVA